MTMPPSIHPAYNRSGRSGDQYTLCRRTPSRVFVRGSGAPGSPFRWPGIHQRPTSFGRNRSRTSTIIRN